MLKVSPQHRKENIFAKEMMIHIIKKNESRKHCQRDDLILDKVEGKDLTKKATLREEPCGYLQEESVSS